MVRWRSSGGFCFIQALSDVGIMSVSHNAPKPGVTNSQSPPQGGGGGKYQHSRSLNPMRRPRDS